MHLGGMDLGRLSLVLLLFGIIVDITDAINKRPRRVRPSTQSYNLPHTGEVLRLRSRTGEAASSGILEIFTRDRFGLVCGKNVNKHAAGVICRQLGYRREAVNVTSIERNRGEKMTVGGVKCPSHAQSIQECDWLSPSDCPEEDIAVITCKGNIGCPDGWIAGATSCYQLPVNKVTRRRFAVNKCAARGGHLVTIETKEESDWLSHIYRNELDGPIITGGVKKSGSWLWETVKLVNSTDQLVLVHGDAREIHTVFKPVEHFKWFPGWTPGNISQEPSGKKIERCLFLSSTYQHPNGSDAHVNYLYWQDERCESTRRRMVGGFRFICEKPVQRSRSEIGCYHGIGSDYRGHAAYTENGAPCIKWTEATEINPDTHPDTGLGEHNFCRNPDGDEMPWCWISDGHYDFCDIPRCPSHANVDDDEEVSCDGFTCSDGRCIADIWTCDMEKDCTGGEDEHDQCDYKLPLFKFTEGLTMRDHSVETYAGTTNETCAKYCLNSKRFVCRSFSFKPRTRECLLSDSNSELTEPRPSRSDNMFELKSQLDNCNGMFKCVNGRCVDLESVCDGKDQCMDFSDEHNCQDESDEVRVRLTGGTSMEGTVEVFYKGEWGVVCDDKWDQKDASVVCSMLGYHGPSKAMRWSHFGSGTGDFLLDNVECKGDESNIAECDHAGWKISDCWAFEKAGVSCTAAAETDVTVTVADVTGVTVRLEGDHSGVMHRGRVVLSLGGIEWNVCGDNWDDADASVVCSMLGYTGGRAVSGKLFDDGEIDYEFEYEVMCTGDESSIAECAISGSGYQCQGDLAGVVCDAPFTTSITSPASTTSTTVTTSAPTTKSTLQGIKARSDCIEAGSWYTGDITETEGGFQCQRWAEDTPHQHKYHNDTLFPEGSVVLARNRCRTPDNDPQPWCYTTDPDERWGYCDIPKCKENCYSVASVYTGHTSQTATGDECQAWSLDSPHKHNFHDNDNYPDKNVKTAGNKCRSPDGDTTPWCYTVNYDTRWAYCNVSKCSGGEFDFNATCGVRPLENNRRRRAAKLHVSAGDAASDDTDDASDDYEFDPSLYRKMGRIYGGSEAVYGMYPWQAGIRRRLGGLASYHRHHCGGTIIGQYWILSAAHCFRDMHRDNIVVRTGDHNNGYRDKYEQEFDVERVIPHDNYDPFTFNNDIALIKLHPNNNRGIVFNDYVQAACLPDETTPYRWRQRCMISGWGEHEHDSESEHLKAARVPLVDDATCRGLYKFTITGQMVCAGYLAGGTDSCAGDSGGPLVCDINGHYTVMGVTSFGEGCGVPNSPGVYARVTEFMPWITQTLRENS